MTSLFVVDPERRTRRPLGILHIHDCLRAGLQLMAGRSETDRAQLRAARRGPRYRAREWRIRPRAALLERARATACSSHS